MAVRICLALIALAWTGTQTASQSPQETIVVDDPRPLAKSLETLEKRYGWVITYEDPRFASATDLVDVTDKVQKSRSPASTSRTLIPRGGTFFYNYPRLTSPSDLSQASDLLEGVVSGYNDSGYPGTFRLALVDGIFHVTPATVRGRDGRYISQSSILETRITVPAKKLRDGAAMLNALAAVLSKASGHKVLVGTIPTKLLVRSRSEGAWTNEVARNVMITALQSTGTRMSWKLFYDPALKTYALNVQQVGK
jgi:hypothetical protein